MPVAFISGGSQGIGASTALLAAKNGYDVCFSYLKSSILAEKLHTEISSTGRSCLPIQADFSIKEDISRIYLAIEDEFGQLDLVVNNAGISGPISSFMNSSYSTWKDVIDLNLMGVMQSSHLAIPLMLRNSSEHKGCIVNVSSVASRTGSPNEYVWYAASKGAIDSFTLGLAKELGSLGIRVNAVSPGIIDTSIHAKSGAPNRVETLKELIPMKRCGKSNEVSETILWLGSRKSSYITGAIVPCSGGR